MSETPRECVCGHGLGSHNRRFNCLANTDRSLPGHESRCRCKHFTEMPAMTTTITNRHLPARDVFTCRTCGETFADGEPIVVRHSPPDDSSVYLEAGVYHDRCFVPLSAAPGLAAVVVHPHGAQTEVPHAR